MRINEIIVNQDAKIEKEAIFKPVSEFLLLFVFSLSEPRGRRRTTFITCIGFGFQGKL